MTTFWERLKAFNRRGILERIEPGYVVEKKIFNYALLLTILLFALTVVAEGGAYKSYLTFSCPEGGPPCFNPFYPNNSVEYMRAYVAERCPDPELCAIEKFAPGETWGREPSFLMKNFLWFVIYFWAVAGVYNHIKNNLGART